MRKPRFKNERTTKFVLLVGKAITTGILTMLIYPLVLILTGSGLTLENWILFIGGTIVGVLLARLKLREKINKKMVRLVFLFSSVSILLVINLLEARDGIIITTIGLLTGILTYTSVKYHFADLEEEIKTYYEEKDPKRYVLFNIKA